MKNLFVLPLASFLLVLTMITSCNTPQLSDDLKMEDFVTLLQEEGAERQEDKPLFQMVNASDGAMLYLDGKPIKLYQFADERSYEKGVEMMPTLKEMPKKGLLVLETSSQVAIDLFDKQ